MNILLVCNNAYTKGNGLSTAIQESQRRLCAAGNEVRIISVANPDENGDQPYYILKHFKFPIFEPIVYSNGFCYANADRKILRKAITWADVVHLEEAFVLQIKAIGIAKKLEKPCVATFHLYPENIMANLGMGLENPLNSIVTWFFRKLVYDRCTDIHCPSEVVKEHLESKRFKARLHVFSNGIDIDNDHVPTEPRTNPYLILCTGRLSKEKSQDTLLEAMKYSKYSNRIQLIFAGNGPKKKKYENSALKLMEDGILSHQPVFRFYPKDVLKNISRQAYLYVHCAWVEVEGLSCLEAIREGTVPVIAKGKLVATSQFALTDNSIYPACDSKALAERIDWWIEHPEERNKFSEAYAASAEKYSAAKSTEAMLNMYRQALGK